MEENLLRLIFNQKREKYDKKGKLIQGFSIIEFSMFKKWFNSETFKQGCHYCGTTNERSFELYEMQINKIRNDGTRGGKRGRRLEIDRRNPSLHYDNLDNLVWCCYWCNNAKSNFFTEEEFRPIAKAIGEVIKNIK